MLFTSRLHYYYLMIIISPQSSTSNNERETVFYAETLDDSKFYELKIISQNKR